MCADSGSGCSAQRRKQSKSPASTRAYAGSEGAYLLHPPSPYSSSSCFICSFSGSAMVLMMERKGQVEICQAEKRLARSRRTWVWAVLPRTTVWCTFHLVSHRLSSSEVFHVLDYAHGVSGWFFFPVGAIRLLERLDSVIVKME